MFGVAEVSGIRDERNRLQADVAVPARGQPALLLFSRPFFEGYQAKVGDRFLPVDSYRGLTPMIELPAGTEGRLTLIYRPRWLVWGSVVSLCSLAIAGVSAFAAKRARR
jgi:hypothetical protein